VTPFEKATGTFPAFATREELLQRLAARAAPRIERHYNPEGPQTLVTQRGAVQADERRIGELESSLSRAGGRFETDLRFSSLHGRPCADFNKNR
jgi:hypothetical protein